MSYKDSKRKAISTDFEVMTLASTDEDVAVHADDGYTYVGSYDKYDHIDEKYSTIDNQKNIIMDSNQINITQEENSQYIPFRMPRYYDGVDIYSLCQSYIQI